MQKYKIINYTADPFDMMCGEGITHEIETWVDCTLEELKAIHKTQLEGDAHTPDWAKAEYELMFGEPYQETPADFDDFLKSCIDTGIIIEVD